MLRSAGLAGLLMMSTGGVALADCSGLGCLFGSSAKPPAPTVQPAVEAGPAPGTTVSAAPAPDATVAAKARPAVKPVHVVTIATGPAEAARARMLGSAMPTTRMKLVERSAARTGSDFSIEATLDAPSRRTQAKLFTEQLHIVAGPSVHDLSDLQGRVVSFGPIDDAGEIVARRAFAAAGVSVKETPLDLDNALDGLASGDVSAVVTLAPQPSARLAAIKGGSLHLVPWPAQGSLPDGAEASSIDAGRYPGLSGQADPIRAVGVPAVLTVSERAEREPAVHAFLAALARHTAALSRHGFDLVKADLEAKRDSRIASADRR